MIELLLKTKRDRRNRWNNKCNSVKWSNNYSFDEHSKLVA
jgi:hypothetical protein